MSDGREQLGQLGLDVIRLSDGVATEIKMLQLGAGGQWLKICQGGDFWTSELKSNRTPNIRGLAVKHAFNLRQFLPAAFVTFSDHFNKKKKGLKKNSY